VQGFSLNANHPFPFEGALLESNGGERTRRRLLSQLLPHAYSGTRHRQACMVRWRVEGGGCRAVEHRHRDGGQHKLTSRATKVPSHPCPRQSGRGSAGQWMPLAHHLDHSPRLTRVASWNSSNRADSERRMQGTASPATESSLAALSCSLGISHAGINNFAGDCGG